MKSRQSSLQQYQFRMEKDMTKDQINNKKEKPEEVKLKQKQHANEAKPKPYKIKQATQKLEKSQQGEKKIQAKKQINLQISGSESSQVQISKQIAKRPSSPKKQEQPKMTNVLFYSNKLASSPSGDLIDVIHKKWWGNYQLLQAHHGFIQWLFPNSFQSRFNRLANPLTLQQAKIFINNREIAERYLKSYQMMLQFYGLKLKSKQTGQLTLCRHPNQWKGGSSKTPFHEQRIRKTFLTSFHNHMRITRMLSSLAMCGFGRYACQFSSFLEQQINDGCLKELKRYGVYERQWKQFKDCVEKQGQISVLLREFK